MARPAWLLRPGIVPYDKALATQRRLVTERQAGAIPDLLLLLEHPEVITVGRAPGGAAGVLAPGDVPVFEIERGGAATYHGPGQLVGYPILELAEGERDVGRYLRRLEDVLIAALARWGIAGERRPGWTGVWAAGHKLASIGVALRRWVTLHGFALNVTTDLTRFAALRPCGLPAAVMGSIESLTGARPAVAEVAGEVAARFAEVFEREWVRTSDTSDALG
jgi:lipoate-protein ligase B